MWLSAVIYLGIKLKSIFYSIAVYKALYKRFGGFAADVVAAIDQVTIVGLLLQLSTN